MGFEKFNKDYIEENLKEVENGFFFFSKEGEKKLSTGRKSDERYASFDYCFNYFQGFKDKREELASVENLQDSCLQLGFYLASWGMLRGSSFLLQKSARFYMPLVKYISKSSNDLWNIDVKNYSENNNIEKLTSCRKDIKQILERDGDRASDILVTKIMLGVFGSVPAFDTYFILGSGLKKFDRNALETINKFYSGRKYLDEKAESFKTFDFQNGNNSERSYTVAKVIDMIFFREGYKVEGERI